MLRIASVWLSRICTNRPLNVGNRTAHVPAHSCAKKTPRKSKSKTRLDRRRWCFQHWRGELVVYLGFHLDLHYTNIGGSRPSTADLISTYTWQLGQVNSDEAWPGVQVHVANTYDYDTHITFHHYLAKAYHDSCSFQRQCRRDEDKYLLLGAVDA